MKNEKLGKSLISSEQYYIRSSQNDHFYKSNNIRGTNIGSTIMLSNFIYLD